MVTRTVDRQSVETWHACKLPTWTSTYTTHKRTSKPYSHQRIKRKATTSATPTNNDEHGTIQIATRRDLTSTTTPPQTGLDTFHFHPHKAKGHVRAHASSSTLGRLTHKTIPRRRMVQQRRRIFSLTVGALLLLLRM